MPHSRQASASPSELDTLRRELERSREAQRTLETLLQQTRQDLDEAVRARDEFITVAAHELRSPLSAIVLYVQNLILTVERDENACSQEIKSDLTRLERRINQFIKRASVLLDVTRLTSGNFHLELERVDLSQLTQQV